MQNTISNKEKASTVLSQSISSSASPYVQCTHKVTPNLTLIFSKTVSYYAEAGRKIVTSNSTDTFSLRKRNEPEKYAVLLQRTIVFRAAHICTLAVGVFPGRKTARVHFVCGRTGWGKYAKILFGFSGKASFRTRLLLSGKMCLNGGIGIEIYNFDIKNKIQRFSLFYFDRILEITAHIESIEI